MDEAASAPKARWWHSRRRLLQVVWGVVLALILAGLFNRQLHEWPLALPLGFGLEWLWFRFLDPNYPHDDLICGDSYAGPPSATVPKEAWQGALAAVCLLGLFAMLFWAM